MKLKLNQSKTQPSLNCTYPYTRALITQPYHSDDEDLMSKVTSLEQDMMRMAREIVNQSRRDLQYSGIPHHELLQDAASGQISMRIAGLRRNKNADEDDSLVLTVVQNRILEGHGMWAGASDEDDDMLME